MELFTSMANKPSTKTSELRSCVQVALRNPLDKPDDAIARTLTRPEVQAAATIQRWDGENHEVNALTHELAAQVASVNSGDLNRAEGILIAQAHTLDALFNNLAKRAHGQTSLDVYEGFLRLAFKAQSQCRATLEALTYLKNPPNVAFVKQANIAHGPQQVNNTMNREAITSRARETENTQNKLSGAENELCQNAGTPTASIPTNQSLETVGEIDGAPNAER